MVFLEAHDRFRLERGAQHLYALGERAIGEFLAEGVSEGDDLRSLLDRLQRYQQCSPTIFRAVGGDRFPRRFRLVPQ